MRLDGDEIHLWRMNIHDLPAACEGPLTPDERRRAAEFIHAEDGSGFSRVRGSLRIVLGAYLGASPALIEIRASSDGKPFLTPDQGRGLAFSVSHSSRTALFAISRQERTGVDVEDLPLRFDFDDVVDLTFSATEAAIMRSCAPADRAQCFLRGWTRKEAMAKAAGSGFLIDPKLISAPLDDAGSWTLAPDHVCGPLRLMDVSEPGLVAALAAGHIARRPRIRPIAALFEEIGIPP
jgi:4'-phosphopantetheinyl transferase